jgi:RNA polymerase sigma-70 factor, ECF subfamily
LGPSDDVRKEGARAGDAAPFTEAAFEAFHGETFGRVWSFARRICGDESEAQDVCQNAYLAVYRYWEAGRLREQPRRLLYRVAQRAAVDVVRSRSRRQRLERALPTDEAAAPWIGPEVRDALSHLKREDATLLLLQAEVGFSYQELSQITKQSVPAVRSRLFRARRDLLAQLERAR